MKEIILKFATSEGARNAFNDLLTNKIKARKDGEYVVRFPWRDDFSVSPGGSNYFVFRFGGSFSSSKYGWQVQALVVEDGHR